MILGINIISTICKKNKSIIGEKSIPENVGNTFLTILYNGPQSSSINANTG